MNQPVKKTIGFAAMDRDRQRQIASLGGRSAHDKGTSREFTSEEAMWAGRKSWSPEARAKRIANRTKKV